MTAPRSGRATVNGLELYYEVHGEGEPLLLLHGGITVDQTLAQTLPALANARQVIVPHMQGHGFTPDIDRPLRFELMADDLAALMAEMGIGSADLVGYSMGGGIALQTAIRHPTLVDRLVVISTTMARDGWYPDVVQAFRDMPGNAPAIAANIARSPLGDRYPDVNWETLFRKIGEMESEPFDWSADIAGIEAPTMLVFADADAVRPEHIVDFYQRLGGFLRDGGLDGSGRPPGRLAVIPNTTHYDLNDTTAVAEAILPFLEAFGPN
ncbi:MAG TPA: alpha/beta hydrolase [Devosiaceae bacterium]|nr:alpha/beta hydrolase [Devosiaceae bacterium]